MGIWDKLKGELIDIVQWLDDTRNTLAYRFERYNNEIKNGAKLVVREGQAAVFVSEGKLADVFGPGTYTLETKNLPILGTLLGWKYGFESPFKAEVYFVSTRIFTDRKWGTRNPIMLRDPEFGVVRLRAFGNAAYRCSEPAVLVKNLVGTDGRLTVEELGDQLRDLLVARFTDALGEAKVAAIDLAGQQDELAEKLRQRVSNDFSQYGLEITSFTIENVSLPPEVEAAMDKRTSMGVIGNMGQYQAYQTAQAIEAAAKNPGGVAGVGAGLGAGIAMAGAMTGAMAGAVQQPTQPPPISPPTAIPPPSLPIAFFAAIAGQQVGPLDAAALQQRLAAGQITRDTLVWKPGMAAWTAAGSVNELAAMFPPPLPVPPPLPPAAK
jgi:membrane protease subunit (stomatin/prohibitin family)